ncbi:DUF3775 domain-containing protein [Nostoc sp. FACHB-145]|uniref:DUF3775 domain-containing protein n=1 Tax=Nostoc sp. FACHB-145 TaxID=2692836 RepID=UPI0016835CEE|nr:DUF3775 domain-containing protein [Nostoc sp. FACHB-145]MBD2468736.1 DUF3775 domain-containing protein [Nostoc sp. FACHB-145]
MKFLTVEKVYEIIELAETLSLHNARLSSSNILHQISSGSERMLEFYNECKNSESPRYKLYDYVNQLSSEELAEAIALMLLGRGHSGEQPSDFPDLVREAEGVVPAYLASKAPLAEYLRQGLEKLNLR